MLSHTQIWAAIDALAERHGYSASGLARAAGLDPTTFNRSKRTTGAGKPRWPSTESIAKVLDATGAPFDAFVELAQGTRPAARAVPLIGFAQAGADGFFDDGGFPTGSGWDEVDFASLPDEHAYALEISGDSMLPVYRDGDIVVVSPQAGLRRGDRVVARTLSGEVMAKTLGRISPKRVELNSLNPDYTPRVFAPGEIAFMHRILWVSQ